MALLTVIIMAWVPWGWIVSRSPCLGGTLQSFLLEAAQQLHLLSLILALDQDQKLLGYLGHGLLLLLLDLFAGRGFFLGKHGPQGLHGDGVGFRDGAQLIQRGSVIAGELSQWVD